MPRIAPVAAILAAVLAGCASPPIAEPVRAAAIAAAPVRAPDPCARYSNPTTFARCHLFSSADGWRYIPEAGRRADLDTQLRCAALRPSPEAYERCVSTPHSVVARVPAAPRVSTLPDIRPSAGPAQVERRRPAIITEAEAVARTIYKAPRAPPATIARTVQEPPAVAATKPPAVARTIQKPPAAVSTPKQVARSWPACAENGSCYGDISSGTGQPKTVHVKGYYRKDGTYVRSHYRSRPRR